MHSRAQQQNPHIYFIGCPCHQIHNTAAKTADAFHEITQFDVEDMLIDIFYWFEKSIKRKNELVEFCTFCGVQYRDIIKHVSVRWLSLELAVQRVLRLYPALRSYFLSGDDRQPRFQHLKQLFENPITEVYLMFFQAILPAFTMLNKFLQRDAPCLYLLHDCMQSFVSNIMGKFIKVSVIREAKESGDAIIDLDYTCHDNQLPDSSIFIGIMTRQQLNKLINEGDVDPSYGKKFYSGVRHSYEV